MSQRWKFAICAAVVIVALGWVAVRGLTGNFVYYLTPTDVMVHQEADVGERIRLGGYVVPGSVGQPGDTLEFIVSDEDGSSVNVVSTGSVPELFRAGQGVVMEGAMGPDGRFHSDTLLVKHDGTYRAPDDGAPDSGPSALGRRG